jgi:chemotaxis regulatin CheY-phosphate phosphatase CheZ
LSGDRLSQNSRRSGKAREEQDSKDAQTEDDTYMQEPIEDRLVKEICKNVNIFIENVNRPCRAISIHISSYLLCRQLEESHQISSHDLLRIYD